MMDCCSIGINKFTLGLPEVRLKALEGFYRYLIKVLCNFISIYHIKIIYQLRF